MAPLRLLPTPAQGRAGLMRGRTFSAPRKWLPGKGRLTMQFGCCYNYAVDTQGRPPGEERLGAAAAAAVLRGFRGGRSRRAGCWGWGVEHLW